MTHMIEIAIPNLEGNESAYLQECITSTFISSVGQFVTRFEEMCATLTGAKYAVATSSGTTGLHLALTAIGVKRDDLVILPAFTFIASANAISHCGASPWLLDISPESWTLCPDCLQEALGTSTIKKDGNLLHKESGKRIAAIMPVYAMGHAANMDPINSIAKEYGLPVIADAAAALGVEYKDKTLASLADITVFSFNGNKTFTAGGGGMLVTDNEELAKLARHLSTTARVGREYHHDMVGFNYRLTNVNAALGCAQLERFEKFIKAKRDIARRYNEELASLPELKPFPEADWNRSACWLSGVVLDDDNLADIESICGQLQEKGVNARTFWKPVNLQPAYAHAPVFRATYCESIWEKILPLPCSTNLQQSEQDTVIKAIKEIILK